MKIVTWNINGVKARRPYLELFLDAHQPDVLCVQELKSPTDKVPTEVFTERGVCEVAIFGQKSWNGVMIASKVPMTDVEMGLPDNGHEDQSRAIAATIKEFESSIYIVHKDNQLTLRLLHLRNDFTIACILGQMQRAVIKH